LPSRFSSAAVALVLVGLAGNAPGFAWYAEGHRRIAVAAVEALPPEVPGAFRASAAAIGDLAGDPDVWKHDGTPHLANGERPEHYLDVERLRGEPWPELRTEAQRRIAGLGLDVGDVGMLPWTIVELTERLALAFAQLRRWPDDEAARAQALVTAGRLAHYAGDLVQPLHTTVHHNGWALPDDSSPLEGIHLRIDALIEKTGFDREAAVAGLEPVVLADVAGAVRLEFAASHALVDRVYELDTRLAAPDGVADPEVVAFTCERYRVGVRFLASLLRTAWEESAQLELQPWVKR
jgi:hypothetical protein